MLDKLEVRVLGPTLFRPEFASLYSDLRNDPKGPFRRQGRHYQVTGDLRQYGYDVILHLHNVHGKGGRTGAEVLCGKCEKRTPHKVTNQELGTGVCLRCLKDVREERFLPIDSMPGEGNHKVEFIDSGKHGFAFLMNDLERIFDVNPLTCGLMRVDCAADVPGLGVPWFQKHLRVMFKRFAAEIGKLVFDLPAGATELFYSKLGMAGVETLNFGKRPNCFRIYNKIAEWLFQHIRSAKRQGGALVLRMQKAGATADEIEWRLSEEGINPNSEDYCPSFEEMYGVGPGDVLTRCERQIGGGNVPTIPVVGKPAREWERLDTLTALKKRMLDYNPYRECEIIQGSGLEPPQDKYTLHQYLAGMQLRDRIEMEGLQQTIRWLNRYRSPGSSRPYGHGKELLQRYAEFIPAPDHSDRPGLGSAVELYERYRYTLSKQLAA